MYSGILIF